jgi:hypothetical protein
MKSQEQWILERLIRSRGTKRKGWHYCTIFRASFLMWKWRLKKQSAIEYNYYFWADDTGFCRVRKTAYPNGIFTGWQYLHGGTLESQKAGRNFR